MKTAVLIDSTFYMEEELIEKYGFYIIPLYINFENISYREVHKDGSQSKEIFERIKQEKNLPKTSQPAAQDFLDKFSEIEQDGYDRVIVLTISSKLSGTVQGATIAAKMYNEEVGNLQIDVFDSNSVAQLASLTAIEIAEQIKVDPEISIEKITDIIEFYSKNSQIYLMVETLDFLAYGGRISGAIAALGNIFGIKPILEIREGEILEFTKVRSTKKGYKVIMEQVAKTIENLDEEHTVLYTHVQADKDAKKLFKVVKEQFSNADDSFGNFQLGPVIGIHVGPGAVAIGWCPKYQNKG